MSSAEDRLDLVFRALSDRTRRGLLKRLEGSPRRVGELAEPFDMSLPAISKHIRILERAGLISRSVEGRVHRCSLNADALQEASDWIAHYRVFWNANLDALASYVEEEE